MGTASKVKLEERESIKRSDHWNTNAKGRSKLLEKKITENKVALRIL